MIERRYQTAAHRWGPGKVHRLITRLDGSDVIACDNAPSYPLGLTLPHGGRVPNTLPHGGRVPNDTELTCKRCIGQRDSATAPARLASTKPRTCYAKRSHVWWWSCLECNEGGSANSGDQAYYLAWIHKCTRGKTA